MFTFSKTNLILFCDSVFLLFTAFPFLYVTSQSIQGNDLLYIFPYFAIERVNGNKMKF